jgi:hypothetical protein
MTGLVLLVCGLVLAAWGTWRGYASARSALMPLLVPGDPTRTLVDSTRPVHARTRVRIVARNVLLAVVWLTIALYGLFLATVGMEAGL